MAGELLLRGNVVLAEGVLTGGAVLVRGERIAAVDTAASLNRQVGPAVRIVDHGEGYIAPGYVDLHVHGGRGADFMDATKEAFATVLSAHVRHGTTSLAPTTTVASHERLLSVLELCRQFQSAGSGPPTCARVIGAHFYGPYFHRDARGCHPADALRTPVREEYDAYLEYADHIATATVAPELAGAEDFVRACARRGVRTNVGHSQATFAQMAEAVEWGVRHVDHLYCAMSDKTKLRQRQPYPMQGGVLEATLYFDQLTTEVIADGKHLTSDLMLLALKIKGPERLALVTDCNRALDMPEGEYIFGPADSGEPFINRDGVGVMPDGLALASSVQGMDHMVRTFVELTGRPVWEVIRLASLTPATIVGQQDQIGSIAPGKRADLLLLGRDLDVQQVFIGGDELSEDQT
jgi:N-acetylglucosamine-6-phosphate deacetylase